ncbi:MAG: hypothetical protein GY753_00795 [Gammaproteobacteria bacterium]|nr:hypothetical protein [Gammaproteobacteria bacterium]
MGCRKFTSVKDAWEFISGLHRQDVSYNLVAVPGRLYCVPRRRQGSYCHADWNFGFAWYEVAGGVTTVRWDDYLSLNAELITEEMELLMLRDYDHG